MFRVIQLVNSRDRIQTGSSLTEKPMFSLLTVATRYREGSVNNSLYLSQGLERSVRRAFQAGVKCQVWK